MSAVFLAVLGDAMKATHNLLRRLDTAPARSAARHTWTVLKLVAHTRLASRATR
jgi:hypothetical protein